MRSSALGLIATIREQRKPIPYIEDAAVPIEKLADYILEVLSICTRYNRPVSLFGHASVGLIHVRPLHDLHSKEDILLMQSIQKEVFDVVFKYKGAWSGEHGDGMVRGSFNKNFFGGELFTAFKDIKNIFDPIGLMNPGKIIDVLHISNNLRFQHNYKKHTAKG